MIRKIVKRSIVCEYFTGKIKGEPDSQLPTFYIKAVTEPIFNDQSLLNDFYSILTYGFGRQSHTDRFMVH